MVKRRLPRFSLYHRQYRYIKIMDFMFMMEKENIHKYIPFLDRGWHVWQQLLFWIHGRVGTTLSGVGALKASDFCPAAQPQCWLVSSCVPHNQSNHIQSEGSGPSYSMHLESQAWVWVLCGMSGLLLGCCQSPEKVSSILLMFLQLELGSLYNDFSQ